jgi:predicted HAD superfamily Cof-like phosphohydrolase
MGQSVGTFTPGTLSTQVRLIEEEVEEFLQAYNDTVTFIQNLKAREPCLKELADLVYVAFQFAAAAGWELDEALDRVHQSNMSKLVDGKPLKRADGKVLKGPNYKPPYLTDLV